MNRLTLQKKLIIAFVGMSLLVVLTSVASFYFENSVEEVIIATKNGYYEVQDLITLQRRWQTASETIDQLFLTRQVDQFSGMIEQDLADFFTELDKISEQPLGISATIIDENQKILDNLRIRATEMDRAAQEITRLAAENRWAVARDLRETVLATQQSQFNEELLMLSQNIQKDVQESFERTTQAQYITRTIALSSSAAALIIAVILGVLTTRAVIRPINNLVKVVQKVTLRDFSPVEPVRQRDEIGNLSRSIALMTDWLRESYESLEERVAERTKELERQNMQIQVAAEIARDVTSSRDMNELLDRAVDLIPQRFGFYHTGIFFLDSDQEYAELFAATSTTGKELLASRHRLKVGDRGLVGYVASTGKARIALDVEVDDVHLQNPLLPNTRSEIALPLKVEDVVIGVLDVQSDQPSAFKEADINVLQILADLLAVAIHNSRLNKEIEENLDELETLYGQYHRRSWQRVTKSNQVIGYQFDHNGVHKIEAIGFTGEEGAADDGQVIHIPLRVRGEKIGTLSVWAGQNKFLHEDIVLLEDLGSRVSQSLDGARLFTEIQRRAEDEKLISQMGGRMRETLDVESVLKTAAEDIYRVLDLAQLTIDLSPNAALHCEDQNSRSGDTS